MNIFVAKLSYAITSEDLNELFSEYGTVTSANVVMDRETGRSKGFGFVEMEDDEAGQKAIKELDGGQYDGRTIAVSVARPREERPASNNRSRGGYNGGRSNRY